MEQVKLGLLSGMLSNEIRNLSDEQLAKKVEVWLRTGKYSSNTLVQALGLMYSMSVEDMFKLMDQYANISCVNL
jgi:hypothetical protein